MQNACLYAFLPGYIHAWELVYTAPACLGASVHRTCMPAHAPTQPLLHAHTHNSMQAHACVHKPNICKQQAHMRVDKFACVPFSSSIGSS